METENPTRQVNRLHILSIFRRMTVKGDRLTRDVLWNMGSLVILGVSGIVLNVVIARSCGQEPLGVFNQVFAFYIVLSQIAVGGLQFSALKHVSYNQGNLPRCSSIVTSALILVSIAAGVLCLAAYMLRHLAGDLLQSPDVSFGIGLVVPGLFLFSLNKVLIYVLNGFRHMRAYALFQSARFILILLGVLVLVCLGYPGKYLPLALTFAELVLFMGLMVYTNICVVRLGNGEPLMNWIRSHISYGVRGVLSGVLHEVNTRVDILMLGYFLDDGAVGIYSLASVLAEGFGQIPVALRWNLDPIIGGHFSRGEIAEIVALAHRVRQIFWPLMFVLGVMAVMAYPLVLKAFLPGFGFGSSWAIFAILVAGLVINAGYRPLMGLLLQGGRPGSHTVLVCIVAISNIVLNIALIPLVGVVGAAIATAMAFVLEAVLISTFARRLLHVKI